MTVSITSAIVMSLQLADRPLPEDYRYYERYTHDEPTATAKHNSGPEPHVDRQGQVRDSILGPWTRVGARTSLSEVWFGRYSYIVNDSSAVYASIGNFCSIARDVRINPGNHPTWRAAQHHFSYRAVSYQLAEEDDQEFFEWRRADHVTLGHDVWVGHGATILAGVNVGTGAVIGAGAVVSRDVEPYSVVVGVPAKPIKQRFPEAVQRGLIKLAWWDWPHEKLAEHLQDFRRLDADAFLQKHA